MCNPKQLGGEQENQEFKAILGSADRSSPVWASWDPVPKTSYMREQDLSPLSLFGLNKVN